MHQRLHLAERGTISGERVAFQPHPGAAVPPRDVESYPPHQQDKTHLAVPAEAGRHVQHMTEELISRDRETRRLGHSGRTHIACPCAQVTTEVPDCRDEDSDPRAPWR